MTRSPLLPLALSGLVLGSLAAPLAAPAAAASPDVVISQVYGGGGNSGATLRRDYVALENRGPAAVSLDGWSVQYASASGTTWQVTRLSGSIAPGASFLVAQAAGAGGTTDLPPADVTGTTAMSATAGKVALVSTTQPLACGTSCAASARDLVGYGAANDAEGSPVGTLSATSAALRTAGPDTDRNSLDFAIGTPAPPGSGTTPPPPAQGKPCETTTPTPVPALQGSGPTSPLMGSTVTTRGVVVARTPGLSGFFLQDALGDGDPGTSDGVFVFLPGANPLSAVPLVPGDVVALTGTVKEFNGLTELDGVTALERCGLAAVPAPTPYALPEPVQGDLERVEGMLVRVPDELTVQQSFFLGRFGQLTLGSGDRLETPTNRFPAGSAEAQALTDANARAVLVLDDGSSAQNPAPVPYLDDESTRRSGDVVTGLTGVLDHGPISSSTGARDYRLHPTVPPAFRSSGRPAAPAAVGGTLRAASFNVLNYFTTLGTPESRGADDAREFARQRDKVFAALAGLDADVVGLVEIERGTAAAQNLVDGLNAHVGAPGRWAVVPDPANGVGTDAIKVAQIYRTDRVARVGESRSPVDQSAFDGIGRPPVAQTYRQLAGGGRATLVVNHLKSKGSCPSTPGPDSDTGDGQGCFNATRVLQARALLAFVGELSAVDPDVLVVGDLNAYAKEDPIAVLVQGGLVDLLDRTSPDSFSYVFDGQSGYLDHALATRSLAAQTTAAVDWHINADEPSVLDYNTEFKPDDRYAPTPYRSSDHDPVLVGLALTPTDADLSAALSGPAQVRPGAAATYELTVRNDGPATAFDVRTVLDVDGLTAVRSTPGGQTGEVTADGRVVRGTTWALPSLASGASVVLRVSGRAPGRTEQVVVTGGVASATDDPRSEDDLAALVTRVRR